MNQHSKPLWIIDSSFSHYYKQLKTLNSDVHYVEDYHITHKYRFDDLIYFFKDAKRPVIIKGSISFCKKMKNFFPGAYGMNNNRHFNVYVNYIDNLLNDDFVIVPWLYFEKNWIKFFELFKSSKIFIRPTSGDKSFTGLTASISNISGLTILLNTIKTMVDQEENIVIASNKKIDREYRCLIGNKEVIGISEYSWFKTSPLTSDPISELKAFQEADRIAKQDWQLDTVYTVDVAITKDDPKIIELNSFASAGLYDMDLKKVIPVIEKIAIDEYYGII